MPMLQLGDFQFTPAALNLDQIARTQTQGFEATKKMGAFAGMQQVNKGDDKITLPFKVYPGQAGKIAALKTIKSMYDAAISYLLVSGTGEILGNWVILSLSTTDSELFSDGTPKKIDGTMELQRVG